MKIAATRPARNSTPAPRGWKRVVVEVPRLPAAVRADAVARVPRPLDLRLRRAEPEAAEALARDEHAGGRRRGGGRGGERERGGESSMRAHVWEDRPVRSFNLFDGELDARARPAGLRLAPRRGRREARREEDRRQPVRAPARRAVFPYHYEYGAEEWLFVRRRPADAARPGRRARAAPGDVVVFPEGPDGAHQVRNDTDEPIRVLMLSTKGEPDAAVYPDSDKIGIWPGTTRPTRAPRRSTDGAAVDYWAGALGLAEGVLAGQRLADDERVHLVRALVREHRLEVVDVPDDRVLERDAVRAEDRARGAARPRARRGRCPSSRG